MVLIALGIVYNISKYTQTEEEPIINTKSSVKSPKRSRNTKVEPRKRRG
jgi:hypothetical protein